MFPWSRSRSNNDQRQREHERARATYPIGVLTVAIPPALLFIAYYLVVVIKGFDMRQTSWWSLLTALGGSAGIGTGASPGTGIGVVDVDLNWHPPRNTSINDLDAALHGTGVYGFIFNSSDTPDAEYGTYNWCNMPHVRKKEYKRAGEGFELRFVEVVSLLSLYYFWLLFFWTFLLFVLLGLSGVSCAWFF